jgi:hypothetical protein
VRSTPSAKLSFGVIVLAALAIMGEEYRLRRDWPPRAWPFSPELPFVQPFVAHAHEAWLVVSAALCVWSIAYIVSLKALWSRPVDRNFPVTLFGAQATLLLVTLLSPLPINADQYVYVGYSELVHLGANPYAPPLKTAPLPEQLRAIGTVWSLPEGAADAKQRILVRSRYGPLWTSMSALVLYPFEGLSIETKARVLRIFAALAAMGSLAMLWLLLRNTSRGTAAVAAFALSPAIVLQTADSAHNDIFAVFFGLVTVLLFLRQRYLLSAAAFAASIAIKFTFAPFLAAFVALVLIRRGIARAAVATVVFVAVLVGLALPYGLERSLLQPLQDVRNFNSPYLVGIGQRAIRDASGLHASAASLSSIYAGVIVACALGIAFFALQRRRLPALEAVTLLAIFCAAHFEGWYAIILAPILIIPSPWAVPLFAGVTLASQVFAANAFVGNYNHLPLDEFVVLAIIAVPGIAIYLNGANRFIYRKRPSEDAATKAGT